MNEICERLKRAGVDAHLSMSGVEIRVPRRPLLLRGGLALLLIASFSICAVLWLAGGFLEPLSSVLAVWLLLAFAALPAGVLMVIVGAFAAFAQIAGPVRRAVAHVVLLTPQTLKVRGRVMPLEELAEARIRRWLDVHTLEVQHRGQWVRVSRSEVGGREIELKALIEELSAARAAALRAEGHDLRAEARPPEQLSALRDRS